jgi:hypothetical protein
LLDQNFLIISTVEQNKTTGKNVPLVDAEFYQIIALFLCYTPKQRQISSQAVALHFQIFSNAIQVQTGHPPKWRSCCEEDKQQAYNK